jgi:cytochrome c peroxidase
MSTIILSALLACSGGETKKPEPKPPEPPPAPAFEPKHAALFGKLPDDFAGDKMKRTDAKIELGRMLYYDPRLSKDDTVSCNSCHKLMDYGVDGQPTSPGVGGTLGGRNSPTVYNAGGHLAQFWDGRAADLEEQAKGPILNPIEMAMADGPAVMKKLEGIPGYPELFKAAFPNDEKPMDYGNLAKAIAVFEAGLVTKDSAYDKYLGGQADALSEEQLQGYDLFVETGCNSCHGGALFGGQMYQKLGVVEPWETKDLGRFEATKNEADKYMFKVPSLRNVEKTAPYLHDGSVASLEEMVVKMAKHQLGKELKDGQAKKIVAFLGSLTGEIPKDYVKKPSLPGMPDDGKDGKAKGKADGEGKAEKGKGKKGE